jgi:hypothetical protein
MHSDRVPNKQKNCMEKLTIHQKNPLHLPWIHETLQFEYSYLNPERNKNNEKGWMGEDKKH